MTDWVINGVPGDVIDIDDRAVQYGDGLFETIAIRQAAARFLTLHIERLQTGCARLSLDIPDEQLLRSELQQALKISAADPGFAVAKIIVSAGQGPRGYRRPKQLANTRMIRVFAAQPRPRDDYENGVTVTRCQTRLAQQPQLAGIKTLNRLEQVLGQSEVHGSKFARRAHVRHRWQAGLRYDEQRVHDQEKQGPHAGNYTLRRLRCDAAQDRRNHGSPRIDYEVVDIDRDAVAAADELFLSNSQFGVLPIREYEQVRFKPGKLTRRIMGALVEQGVTECSA